MRVHVERNWRKQQIDVWLWDRAGKYMIFPRFEKGELVYDQKEMTEHEAMSIQEPPTFSLPPEVFEDIIRAAEGHVHPQDATVKHLADAIELRDRMLGMVESEWKSRQLEKT